MDQHLKRLLKSHPSAWRFPIVWHELGQDRDIDVSTAMRDVLARIAELKDAVGVFTELLAAGRFDSAEMLLGDRHFLAAAEPNIGRLRQELDLARRNSRFELRSSLGLLIERAQAVGVDPDRVMKLMSEADTDTARSKGSSPGVTDRLRDEVDRLTRACLDTLRARAPVDATLRAAFDVCVEQEDVIGARTLVERASRGDGPHFHERPHGRPWTFPEAPERVLEWFLRTSPVPAETAERFRVLRKDTRVVAVCEAMHTLMTKEPDFDSCSAFCRALDAFLGGERSPITIDRIGDCVHAVFPGIVHGAPILQRRGGELDIVLPMKAGALRGDLPIGPPIVVFDPSLRGAAIPADAVRLTADALFALMFNTTDRRVDFVRLVGRQLRLRGALEATSTAVTATRSFDEARSWIRDVFDALELSATPEAVDLLAWLPGDLPETQEVLVATLLDELDQRSGGTRPLIRASDVYGVWYLPALHSSIVAQALERLRRESKEALFVLGMLLVDDLEDFSTTDVEDFASMRDVPLSTSVLESTFERLGALGFLRRTGERMHVRRTGMAGLLRHAFMISAGLLEESASAARGGSAAT